MKRVLGISGSLRAGSINAGLLRAAASAMPEGAELVVGSIVGVPLYNGDEEAANGTPPAVEMLREQLAAADGLILATPEYNNSIPGVFKNAIDWMASGRSARLFVGKPVAVMGASPMGFGTIQAQDHWLPILRALKMHPYWNGRLMVSRSRDLFDADGNLTDATTQEKVSTFVHGFVGTL